MSLCHCGSRVAAGAISSSPTATIDLRLSLAAHGSSDDCYSNQPTFLRRLGRLVCGEDNHRTQPVGEYRLAPRHGWRVAPARRGICRTPVPYELAAVAVRARFAVIQ